MRVTSPLALRIDMISKTLSALANARTDSAATEKDRSVPVIQNASQNPSDLGANHPGVPVELPPFGDGPALGRLPESIRRFAQPLELQCFGFRSGSCNYVL